MSKVDLDALQAKLDAATPGPWKTDGPESIWSERIKRADCEILLTTPRVFKNETSLDLEACHCEQCAANTALIAALRNEADAMIAELRAARAAIAAMREYINTITGMEPGMARMVAAGMADDAVAAYDAVTEVAA